MAADTQDLFRSPVLVVTIDAGMTYSLLELDTAAKYKIPIICMVFNNNCWGTWPRAAAALDAHVPVSGESAVQMAEGFGVASEYVRTQERFHDFLRRIWKTPSNNLLSTLINVQEIKELAPATQYPRGNYVNPEPSIGGLVH
jgi:acetolactate synthase-1/2/3 large subunit